MQGYKHVVGLLKKAMAKGKKDRIKVLYIISSICRKSRSQLGAKDKYGVVLTPQSYSCHMKSCPRD